MKTIKLSKSLHENLQEGLTREPTQKVTKSPKINTRQEVAY